MTPKGNRGAHWPHNQWHPAYESFREWLDSEAPATPKKHRQKRRRK